MWDSGDLALPAALVNVLPVDLEGRQGVFWVLFSLGLAAAACVSAVGEASRVSSSADGWVR